MIQIAVDAMGGDHGPKVMVPAAIASLEAYSDITIVLVGVLSEIEPYLKHVSPVLRQRIRCVEASEVVGMDESPASALRYKKDSSMRVMLNLVKEKEAHSCVSSGNTGALMAIARFVLKTLPGIDRPAIVYALPRMSGEVLVLDLGANVDCQPQHLVEFSIMGSVLAQSIFGIAKPRVALLNIGLEAIKGSALVKETDALLQRTSIHYVGYAEGNDIFLGDYDVVVCDGFVGNVALKAVEGASRFLMHRLKACFTQTWYARCVAFFAAPLLKRLKHSVEMHNGANLLGLRGVVIKSHGSAGIEKVKAAILVARRDALQGVPAKIESALLQRHQHEELKVGS